MSPQQQRTLEALKAMPGTAAEVAEDLGESTKTVGMRLSRMLDRDLVSVIGSDHMTQGRPARIFGVKQ